MDDSALTSRLLAALPEAQWAEVNRRLHAHPELWRAAHQPETLDAFLRLGDDLGQWRPGPLGLATLAAQTPAADGNAESWLVNTEAGQARLAAALGALRTKQAELDLADSAAAAIALRAEWAQAPAGAGLGPASCRRGQAVALEAAQDAERWRLPVACLYGLMAEPLELVQALFHADGKGGASLAAHALLLNCTTAETAGAVQALAKDLKPAGLLGFVGALLEAGADDAARQVGREVAAGPLAKAAEAAPASGQPESLIQYAQRIAADIQQALLIRGAGDLAAAQQALASAIQSLQLLSGQLSAALGDVAIDGGDYVSALAAFQVAQADGARGSEGEDVGALQAQALLALGRPEEAIAELSKLDEPAPLAMAAAHHALGNAEEARQWARQAVLAAPPPSPKASVLKHYAGLARLFAELGDTAEALHAQTQAAACRPWHGETQARLAEMLWQAGRQSTAHSAAIQALACGPDGPRFTARKIVAAHLSRNGQDAEALPHWKAALAHAPDDPDLTLSLARSAHAAGQWELARDAAQVVLGENPRGPRFLEPQGAAEGCHPPVSCSRHAEAHRILGEVAAAQGDDAQAIKQFEQAVALDPNLPGPWLSIAAHRRAGGDLAGALEVLAEASRRAPKSPEIAAALGRLYEDLGRSSDAIDAVTRATILAPAEAIYQRDLGLMLYQHRYLQGAMEAFRRALQLSPDDVPSLHHLALALLAESGETGEAYTLLQRATSLSPADPAPFHHLGRLALQLHHVDAAQAALRKAIELQPAPGESETLALLGQAYEAAGDYEAALDTYRQAISLSPTRADLNLRVGVCCLAAGQIEAAIAALTEAVETDGASAMAHRELGKAYAAAGMWGEAAMAFEYAATLDPGNAELHHLHGKAALGVAKTPGADAAHWNRRAVAALQRAAQLKAEHPDAVTLADLGRALSTTGRAGEARQAYDAALLLAPASAVLRLDVAKDMVGLGDHNRASDLLAEAAALSPDDLDIAQTWARASLLAGRLEEAHKAFVRAADLAEAKVIGPAAGARRAGYLRQAGECIWSLGRTREATSFWQKALELDPDDAATRARLGAALLQQGRHAEALNELERVLEARSPQTAQEARLDAARAAIGAGDFERALSHLEQAIAEAPAEAEPRYLSGQTLAALRRPLQALEAFREAARLDPKQGLYPAAIARTLAAQGDTAEAVAAAESALKLAGDKTEVLSAAGEVFLAVEDFKRAAEVLRRAADAQPDRAEAWLALAQALTLLVEAEAPWIEAGLAESAGDGALPGAVSGDVHELLNQALHKAAVLGASPNAVREWTGRARAFVGDPKEAIVLLDSVAGQSSGMTDERQAAILLALGHAYRRDGTLDRARTVLDTALAHAKHTDDPARRLSPGGRLYPAVLLEIGQTALALQDNAAALNAGRRAAAAAPRNPVLLHFLATALLAMGDRREAAAALERALALQPKMAHWHSMLAHALDTPRAADDDFAAALAHYRLAAELAPRTAVYALDLARALADNGDLLAAANEYHRLTDLAPDLVDAWREWGLLSIRLGGYKMAADCFEQALALAPSDVEAMVGSARAALALGNPTAAQAKINAALRLSSSDPEALACLSDICAARGDTGGALAANAKAIASAPAQADAVDLRLARARILRSAGRLDEAIGELRRLAEEEPEADEAYGLLGDALMVTRRVDEALEQYRQAIGIAPQRAAHLLRLGHACREAGQLDQALAQLLQARDYVEGPAQAADVQREIGKTFEARRQIDRALEAYRQAIQLNPNQPENYLRAGIAHKMLKQYAEAQDLFQRVIELDPSNVEAHRQLVQVAAFELLQGAKLAAGAVQRAPEGAVSLLGRNYRDPQA